MDFNTLVLITSILWITLMACILFTTILNYILFRRLKILKRYEQSSHVAQIIIDQHLYEG